LKKSSLLEFVAGRIKRVFVPYWIATVSFLTLDYVLLAQEYSLQQKILTMLGINIDRAILDINGTWFITLLLFFYCVFIVSTFSRRRTFQLCVIFLIPALLFFLELRFDVLNSIMEGFLLIFLCVFLFLFPLGCLLGIYFDEVKKLFDYLSESQIKGYSICIALAFIFIVTRRFALIYSTNPNPLYVLTAWYIHIISLIALVIFVINFLVSFKLTSSFLELIGIFSYEIFLLHLPFMIKYDFILFRLPLEFSFFIYFAVICLLSYFLRKVSTFFARTLF